MPARCCLLRHDDVDVETALAATAGEDLELLDESADLLYHLLVLLRNEGLTLADIAATLEKRHG